MELQKCMEEFIKRKETMDDVERNGKEDTTEETYEKQFLRLRDISYNYKADGVYTSVEGEKRCNIHKNRYKDIVPYDHSRVKLFDPSNEPGLDYINASYIKGIYGNSAYIAAQGPLPDTVVDFWKMLWANNVKVILMACNEYEGIPRKLRCQRYWAMDSKEMLDFDDIVVTLTSEEKTDYEEYKVRHLRVTRGAESRDMTHLHYVAWPDRGVPKCIPSIRAMIERMRRIQPADQLDAPPVVVHCSAGCGRTGTILVLDYVKNLLQYKKNTEQMKDFSLYSVIAEMRKQRMAIVQSLDQYVFVHEAVVEMFRHELQTMKTASTRSNEGYYNIVTGTPKSTEKRPTNQTNSEYEVLDYSDPFDPVPVTAPKKSSLTKPDSFPVVPKPRTSNSSSDISASSKPEPPRKPSYEKSPSPTESPVLPNLPQRPSATTEKPVVPTGKPGSRSQSFSDPNKLPMNDNNYSEVYKTKNGSLKKSPPVPVVVGDSEYAEVGVCEPTTASSVTFNNKSNAYEYADPNALGKWSLQDVARGVKKPNNLYASVGDYADVDYSSTAGNISAVMGRAAGPASGGRNNLSRLSQFSVSCLTLSEFSSSGMTAAAQTQPRSPPVAMPRSQPGLTPIQLRRNEQFTRNLSDSYQQPRNAPQPRVPSMMVPTAGRKNAMNHPRVVRAETVVETKEEKTRMAAAKVKAKCMARVDRKEPGKETVKDGKGSNDTVQKEMPDVNEAVKTELMLKMKEVAKMELVEEVKEEPPMKEAAAITKELIEVGKKESESEDEYEYAYITMTDKTRVVPSDSDEEAPKPPPKNFAPHTSTSSSSDVIMAPPPSATESKTFLRTLTGMVQMKKTVDPNQFATPLEPAKVFYHSVDISFPNRVSRPKYGKRPIKMLIVPAVM